METTAIGIGLVMTAVAVAVGGLMLEATLLVLRRTLRIPVPPQQLAPVLIDRDKAQR